MNIKQTLATGNYPLSINISLLILRIAAGGFMLTHGYSKLLNLINGNMSFADPIGLGNELSLYLAVFAEIGCAVFILLGLFTRIATIPLIITMAVAAFIIHGNDDFGTKEMSLIYLCSYIVILLSGAGKYSVDALISSK